MSQNFYSALARDLHAPPLDLFENEMLTSFEVGMVEKDKAH
jgi:hypothetical protein